MKMDSAKKKQSSIDRMNDNNNNSNNCDSVCSLGV